MGGAIVHLALLNVFAGDIQGGLGPFLATYLTAHAHWGPGRIGIVTTVVGLAGLGMNAPAGLLVDQTRSPRLLLAASCLAIVCGTLMVLLATGMPGVIGSLAIATAGGALVVPGLTLLTLGTVGKKGFPRQQGINQAANHAGILLAAGLVLALDGALGAGAAFWVLAGMGLAAALTAALLPRGGFDTERAHGPGEPSARTKRGQRVFALLRNRKLALMALTLGLFNLSNGALLSLMGQRLSVGEVERQSWMAVFVIVAQATMIPVALWAGSLADRKGRRRLLLIACAATPLRAVLCAFCVGPWSLLPAEILDGISSGLIGVAIPILVADITWGSGRTQTAIGLLNTLSGIGGALSGVFGGMLAHAAGWRIAFLLMGVPALMATALAFRLGETRGMDERRDDAVGRT